MCAGHGATKRVSRNHPKKKGLFLNPGKEGQALSTTAEMTRVVCLEGASKEPLVISLFFLFLFCVGRVEGPGAFLVYLRSTFSYFRMR